MFYLIEQHVYALPVKQALPAFTPTITEAFKIRNLRPCVKHNLKYTANGDYSQENVPPLPDFRVVYETYH